MKEITEVILNKLFRQYSLCMLLMTSCDGKTGGNQSSLNILPNRKSLAKSNMFHTRWENLLEFALTPHLAGDLVVCQDPVHCIS